MVRYSGYGGDLSKLGVRHWWGAKDGPEDEVAKAAKEERRRIRAERRKLRASRE